MDSKVLKKISEKEWYYGSLSEDEREHGIGLKRERDGSLYYGLWQNGLRDGSGVLSAADGGLLVGTWEDDRSADVKLRVWPIGSSYILSYGKIERGKLKEGVLLCADGKIYCGIFSEWREGEFDGEGALLWPDKRIYAGRWKNGGTDVGGVIRRKDGRMTGTLSNVRPGFVAKSWQQEEEKQFFYGTASDDETRNAVGIWVYANEEVFVGEMKGGKKSGSGVYRSPDGSITIGEWEHGVLQKQGMRIHCYSDTLDFYAGNFENSLFEGEGCLLHRSQSGWELSHSGSWKMGMPDISLEEVREPGPFRKSFSSMDEIVLATLNSLEKYGEYENEQCFAGIRADADSAYQRMLCVEPGCDYEVRVFYHNDASNKSPGEDKIAKETKLRVFFTKNLKPGEDGVVSASISSENTSTPVVWDCVKLSSTEELSVSYKIATAKIHNDWKMNGHILPQILFTGDGVYLGTNGLDGVLPPGESGFVTFILHTSGKKSDTSVSFVPKPIGETHHEENKNAAVETQGYGTGRNENGKKRKRSRISINVKGSCGTDEYAKTVNADIGEEISVRLRFTNNASEQDIKISVALPPDVELVEGSSILNLWNGTMQKQPDNWIKDGLFFSDFAADGDGEITFRLRYFPSRTSLEHEKIEAKIETAYILMQSEMYLSGR